MEGVLVQKNKNLQLNYWILKTLSLYFSANGVILPGESWSLVSEETWTILRVTQASSPQRAPGFGVPAHTSHPG